MRERGPFFCFFSLGGKEKKGEYGICFVRININEDLHVQKIALMK